MSNSNMSYKFSILLLLSVACFVFVLSETTFDDRVESLPGYGAFPEEERVFAGFVDVKHEGAEGTIFYWFVGQYDHDVNAPVLVWSNGGPGSSAMIGFFAETGPFRIQEDMTLKKNPHSWTRLANMLFIDHPIGTGFSYAKNETSYSKDQDQVSSHLLQVIEHFYDKHPEYKKNALYLTGESYAGKYMPTLAERIVKKNLAGESNINLQGVMLGDAFVAPAIQRVMKPEQAYWNGLIGRLQLEQMRTIAAKCIRHIHNGYTNQIHSACEDLKSYMLLAAGIVNVYDVRKFVPSTNKGLINTYLNLPEVREALHVPAEKLKYNTNAKDDVYMALKDDILRSVKHLIPFMLKHMRVMLYNGNFDLQDGPVGTEQYLTTLEHEIPGVRLAPRNLWFFGEKVAGWEIALTNLTFLTVHGAGHFVPTDQPKHALEMLRKFLNQEPFCSKGQSVPLSFTTLTPDEFKGYLDVDENGVHRVPCAITDVLCHRLLQNCSGNGECHNGACHCNSGFTGKDCSVRLESLKPKHVVTIAEIVPQEWMYFELDTQAKPKQLFHGSVQITNTTAMPDIDHAHTKLHPYFVGEGLGGPQPFGAVCIYVRRGHTPSWLAYDSVQCFNEDYTDTSFVSSLSRVVPGRSGTYYIGIFNAQPYNVQLSFEYQFISQDLLSKVLPKKINHDEL